jgi:hypothetical protein
MRSLLAPYLRPGSTRPQNYCVVNEAAGYLYVNVPKVACSSIKLAIAQHLDVPFATVQWHAPWRQEVSFAARRKDLVRFTFVRHPGDRLVSTWADWCQPPYPNGGNYRRNPHYLKMRGCSFAEFVREAATWSGHDKHTRRQTELLHLDGEMVVDQVFRFERLAAGWAELQDLLGLPDLPHDRKSEHRPWREYFTEELEQLAKELYGGDCEAFGYEW